MVDNIVKRGSLHRAYPEDYSLAEEVGYKQETIPFIVVADGCSGGAHTEVGAMIVCHAARAAFLRLLREEDQDGSWVDGYFQKELFNRVLTSIKTTADELIIPWNTMIATLRMAWVRDEKIYTIEAGDGYQLGVKQDSVGRTGTYFVKYEYAQNAPFYPAYIAFDQVRSYETIDNNDLTVTVSGAQTDVKVPSTTIFYNVYDAKDFVYFGMASDGLGTYRKRDFAPEVYPDTKVLEALTDFKNSTGTFMVRRFQRFDAEMLKDNFDSYDDISVAMINVEECLKVNRI
jgi:hypothetical protein